MQEGNGIKRKPWEEGSCSTLLVGRLAFCNLPVPVLRRLPSLEPEMLSCNGFQCSRAIRCCTYCNDVLHIMQSNVEQSGVAHIAMWSNHIMHLRVPTGRLPPRCENKFLLSCGQITESAVHTCARHCLGLGDATIESNHCLLSLLDCPTSLGKCVTVNT